MSEQTIARDLTLLATEVDSLEKALVLSKTEQAHESERRKRADAQAEKLRQELRHARRRAKAAERELSKLSAGVGASEHRAHTTQQGLREQLDQAQQRNKMLQHEIERVEAERRALQENLREVLANLRHAAREARPSGTLPREVDDVTLVSARPRDVGW
jgi:septal ring factor EnvC (AmiA/AmiB activator)